MVNIEHHYVNVILIRLRKKSLQFEFLTPKDNNKENKELSFLCDLIKFVCNKAGCAVIEPRAQDAALAQELLDCQIVAFVNSDTLFCFYVAIIMSMLLFVICSLHLTSSWDIFAFNKG